MHPTLTQRWNDIESRRHAFLADLDALPPEAIAFHPAPGAWSLEDLAQHLLLVEQGITQVLAQRADKPPLPADPLTPLKLFLMRALGPRSLRVRAPIEQIVPRARMPLDVVRAEWQRTRDRLRDVLERVPAGRVKARIFRHPVFGAMDHACTVEFIAIHHDHHLHQVRRIKGARGFPGR